MTVAGLLLAAGGGSRFDGPDHKLVTPFRARPLAAWSIGVVSRCLADGDLDAVYVVTGAVSLNPALRWILEHHRPDTTQALVDVPDQSDATLADHLGLVLVPNKRWAEGQGTSLAAGIARAEVDGHDSVVVGLADQPFIEPVVWSAVAAVDAPIVSATFDGKRRPPVKLSAEVWPLLSGAGDEGARTLLRMRPDLVSEVPCMGNPIDIDTLEDIEKWS